MGRILFLLLGLGALGAGAYYLLKGGKNKSKLNDEPPSTMFKAKEYTTFELTVGFSTTGLEEASQILSGLIDLNKATEEYYSPEAVGNVAILLKQNQHLIKRAAISTEIYKDLEGAEESFAYFNDTLSSKYVNGNSLVTVAPGKEDTSTNVVVSMVVTFEGTSSEVEKDILYNLAEVLQVLDLVQYLSDNYDNSIDPAYNVLKLSFVHYSPAFPDELLTDDQLIMNYPELTPVI